MATSLQGKSFLLITYSFAFGGAEKQICLLARFLADSGAKVYLLPIKDAVNPYKDLLNDGVEVTSIHLPPAKSGVINYAILFLKAFGRTRKKLKEIQPDFTISFLTLTNIFAILSGFGTGRKVVVSERVYPDPSLSNWSTIASHWIYLFASKIVVQTKRHEILLSKRFGERVACIPNFLQSKKVPLPDWSSRDKTIIAAGRLDPQKGFDLLIEAAEVTLKEKTDWKIKIIGDGLEKERLQQMILSKELSGRIEIVSATTQIFDEFLKAQVFVLSSRFEGYPNVLTEALAAGLAIVSFDCNAGPAEILEDQVSGLLVEPESSSELARTLTRIINCNELRQSLSRAASSRYHYLSALAEAEQRWNTLVS